MEENVQNQPAITAAETFNGQATTPAAIKDKDSKKKD